MKHFVVATILFIINLPYADPKHSVGWFFWPDDYQFAQFEYLVKPPYSVFAKPTVYASEYSNNYARYRFGLGVGAGRYISIISKENFKCDIYPYIMPSFIHRRQHQYTYTDSLSHSIQNGIEWTTSTDFEFQIGIVPELKIYNNLSILLQPLLATIIFSGNTRNIEAKSMRLYELAQIIGGVKFYF